MNRLARARVAQETLAILERGEYRAPAGHIVSIRAAAGAAIRHTVLHTPEQLARLPAKPQERGEPTRFEVTNETTLSATRRLAGDQGIQRLASLNFASAKHPGGGFLGGSQAQEESLARSSGLYPCLRRRDDFYAANRTCGTTLYTDNIIYSPDVPVFRNDAGDLLDEPYPLSFITAPAVNAGAVRRNEPDKAHQIEPVMRRRAANVFQVALLHGHEHLVLGAWGCGVFRNSPVAVARIFGDLLLNAGPYKNAFGLVAFAVPDPTAALATAGAFQEIFAGGDLGRRAGGSNRRSS